MPTIQMTNTQIFALRLALQNYAELRALFGLVPSGWPQSKEPLSASAAASAEAQCDDDYWRGLSGGSGASL